MHRHSFHLQNGCSIAKFLVDLDEACALCLLPIPFSYSVLVPDCHFGDLPPLEKSATMGFPISFIFPLCLWSGCDSSWACIPSFEDLGPPHDELAPVTHSALQWRNAFQEEKRQNLRLTAASPVVAQPPPGGSCQVLCWQPGLPAPAAAPPLVPCLVPGGQQLHRTHLWLFSCSVLCQPHDQSLVSHAFYLKDLE